MRFRVTALAWLVALSGVFSGLASGIDLKNAVVATPSFLTKPHKKAVQTLVEEVEERSQVRLAALNSWPSGSTPVIAIGQSSALQSLARNPPEQDKMFAVQG